MDNLNLGRDDEEYHFSENDNPDMFGRETMPGSVSEPQNVFDRLKRKNLFIALGVIIAFLVVYKIIGFFIHPNNKIPEMAASSAGNVANQAQVNQTPNSQVNTNLAEDAAENKQQMLQIQAQMAQMGNYLTDLSGKIDVLSNTIQNLSNELIQQQSQITAMQNTKKKATLRSKRAVTRTVTYYVQAMIPGRAWLKTANGDTVTVSSGDQLPGYGMIEAIDPEQGVITTSSGKEIRFSPSDS